MHIQTHMSTNKVTSIGINIFRADELKFVSLYLNHGISCEYTKHHNNQMFYTQNCCCLSGFMSVTVLILFVYVLIE